MDWFRFAAWLFVFGMSALFVLAAIACILNYEKDREKPPKHATVGRFVLLWTIFAAMTVCAWFARPF